VQHHEKWDGSGYPQGLCRSEIDLKARIFAVADAFDAIISNRVYRKGRSYEEAIVELDLCAGQHFDPQVVEAFHRVGVEEWKELCAGSSEAVKGLTGDQITDCKPSPSCVAVLEGTGTLAPKELNLDKAA
jgi:HD-GYP domain-containing protein (c-di-GMP phosphodiesterase class II)